MMTRQKVLVTKKKQILNQVLNREDKLLDSTLQPCIVGLDTF